MYKYDYTHSVSDDTAMKECFDLIPTGKVVAGKINASSQFFYVAYAYTGSQYGSMIAVLFNGNVKIMGVSGGTKTIRTL